MTGKKKPTAKAVHMQVDAEAIRNLADFFKDTDLTEIEYEKDGCRIRVCRGHNGSSQMAPTYVSQPTVSAPVDTPSKVSMDPESHPGAVKSPMVGTAYMSPKPDSPKFVEVGTTVSAGQVLMIIEAMKVMNPLKSPRDGKITSILVEDGQPVEYDQPLFIIE
jgi:acetyl-CoA carboxylase biotin carboxyl carrier protein